MNTHALDWTRPYRKKKTANPIWGKIAQMLHLLPILPNHYKERISSNLHFFLDYFCFQPLFLDFLQKSSSSTKKCQGK